MVRKGFWVGLSEAKAHVRVNPTMEDAVANSTKDLAWAAEHCAKHGRLPGLKPMKIERLIAMGGPYSDEDQARVLYHQLGSEEKVADRMKKPRSWTRQVLAYDIEQRRLARPLKAAT